MATFSLYLLELLARLFLLLRTLTLFFSEGMNLMYSFRCNSVISSPRILGCCFTIILAITLIPMSHKPYFKAKLTPLLLIQQHLYDCRHLFSSTTLYIFKATPPTTLLALHYTTPSFVLGTDKSPPPKQGHFFSFYQQ